MSRLIASTNESEHSVTGTAMLRLVPVPAPSLVYMWAWQKVSSTFGPHQDRPKGPKAGRGLRAEADI